MLWHSFMNSVIRANVWLKVYHLLNINDSCFTSWFVTVTSKYVVNIRKILIGAFTFLHDSQIMKTSDQKVARDHESGMARILQISSSSNLHALTPPPTIYSRSSLKRNVTPVMAFDSNICHLSLEEKAKRENKKVLMMLAKYRSWVPGGKGIDISLHNSPWCQTKQILRQEIMRTHILHPEVYWATRVSFNCCHFIFAFCYIFSPSHAPDSTQLITVVI